MPQTSFSSLAIVLIAAFFVPLALGLVPRFRVPGVVVEIILGIVIGPDVLNWARADEAVRLLALIGVGFLLFLAGLELDIHQLRGPTLRSALAALGLSAFLAIGIGYAFDAANITKNPLLVAVTLSATSLGIVLGVLKERGENASELGQTVIAGSSLADFSAIVALSLLFSRDASRGPTKLILLGVFATLVVVVGAGIAWSSRLARISSILARLQDGTTQIRVRGAMVILVLFVVLAQKAGLETILGAFVAGSIVGLIDREAVRTHPNFQHKLDAIGYGFLIPVFFVASGLRFDLLALTNHPSTLARVPLFLLALLVVRGIPAILYRKRLGSRGALAAGLLQATSLPFIVTATMIGVEIGALSAPIAAAMVAAGLVSALVFPIAALAVLSNRPSRAPSKSRLLSAPRVSHKETLQKRRVK